MEIAVQGVPAGGGSSLSGMQNNTGAAEVNAPFCFQTGVVHAPGFLQSHLRRGHRSGRARLYVLSSIISYQLLYNLFNLRCIR